MDESACVNFDDQRKDLGDQVPAILTRRML